ncbi:MAG: hypothetical protein NW241_20370 [Bacteroidia bacterium]|nr:hypothetical protein [Bacteroidia bacterium]
MKGWEFRTRRDAGLFHDGSEAEKVNTAAAACGTNLPAIAGAAEESLENFAGLG